MDQEPLQLLPPEKWPELQSVFISDWPRSLPGYNVLETQARFLKQGFGYGFEAYILFGDASNGFLAINKKMKSYELIIQYPKDNTSVLEKALKTTKLIDWDTRVTLAFTATHVIEVIQKILKEKGIQLTLIASHTFIIEKDSPEFEDVSLPNNYTFELLSLEHLDFIDIKWPHRYPSSIWYFELLIKTESGYGLFKDGQLVCWIFISECGHLTHLYTVEEYRKQGLAALMLKLISNKLLKEKRQVYAFCVKGNKKAFKLYNKLGFKETNGVAWVTFSKNYTLHMSLFMLYI